MSEHKQKRKRRAIVEHEQLVEVRLGALEIGTNVREPSADGQKELAASVREVGILSPPLVVRRGDRYRVVDGHRRAAAAKAAGLATVPVRVIDATDQEILQVQLVANLQREGLSALEEARGFRAWLDTTGGSQTELAKAIGKSPPYVSSRLKLLELPEKILAEVDRGKISDSHAEVIARAPRQIQHNLAQQVTVQEISVHRLEEEARWKAQRFREVQRAREEFQARVAKARFPTCQATVYRSLGGTGKGETPYACGRKALRADYRGGDWVTCGLMDHAWSLSSGKEPEKPRAQPASAPTPRQPEPKLPLVDPQLSFAASPADLATYAFAASPKVRGVFVGHRKDRTDVLVRLEIPRVLVPSVAWFVAGDLADGGRMLENLADAPPTVPGRAFMGGCDSWDQQTDATRKNLADAKAALEAFGVKLAGVPRGKRGGE